ncbi:MAG: serine/threonine protein kinase [Deltaproteobacteria bacterium]|nr:serine/threonine protein kinase [Deltaproteobacteria bacterium]
MERGGEPVALPSCPVCGARYPLGSAFCPEDGARLAAPAPSAPRDPLVGQTVEGRYRVEDVLGHGGMGVVYGVTHTGIGKRFAMKVLRRELTSSPEAVDRFYTEARAAASIGSDHIVDISDFVRLSDGSVGFVMELLDGEPLSTAMRRGLALEEIFDACLQTCEALAAAHRSGIVHRDLKPDNIFLVRRASGTFVKVVDFGVAKVAGSAKNLTRTGTVFGTPYYMSPEQAAGKTVDARTDVYAMGVIMYEMVTGKVPFEADTFMGILTKHLFETPLPPRELKLDMELPVGLESVILMCLEKDPRARYQDMDDLFSDLELAREGKKTRADGLTTLVVNQRSSADRRRGALKDFWFKTGDHGGASSRRRKALVAAVAAVSAAAIGAAVFALLGPAPGPVPPGGSTLPAAIALQEPAPVPASIPAAAPSSSTVRVESRPADAVLVAGDLPVGRTPIDITRPAGGDKVYVLRKPGYGEEKLLIGPMSPPLIEVALQRAPGPAPHPAPAAKPSAGKTPETPAAARTKRPGDIVDPWSQCAP